MLVRPAEMRDYDDLCELLRQIDDLHAVLLPGYFRKVRGRPRSREAIDRILRARDETMIVVENDAGRVAGLVHVQIYDTPPVPVMVPKRRAHVDNIVVAAGARRHGFGSVLMDAATRWARDKGAAEVLLTVWAGNEEAERFYEKLGFGRINSVLGRPL